MAPLKIQPIDSPSEGEANRFDSSLFAGKPPVLKSRLKRFFDRPFSGRNVEKTTAAVAEAAEFEPSSVCLRNMVQNFIEDSTYEHRRGRSNCNCFNGNIDESSDDEFFNSTGFSSPDDPSDTLKSLTPCASVAERNLLADASKTVEKHNSFCKRKDELMKFVTDGLILLNYDASICKSRWERTSSFPAGEYEYIDVIVDGERIVIDVDFRSEFEIARPTANYKTILSSLPHIFVGKPDRLQQILLIISDAAKQSLKKKGMHVPPWRKFDYLKSKFLSPHTRSSPSEPNSPSTLPVTPPPTPTEVKHISPESKQSDYDCGELELIFGELEETELPMTKGCGGLSGLSPAVATPWQPPAVKPRVLGNRKKDVTTGLASLFRDKA